MWKTGWNEKLFNGSTMRDRSDNPTHHEQMHYHRDTSRSRNEEEDRMRHSERKTERRKNENRIERRLKDR